MNNGKGDRPNFVAAAILAAQAADQQAEAQRRAEIDNIIQIMERAAQPYLEKLREAGVSIAEGEASLQNEGKSVSSLQYRLSLTGFSTFWLVVQPWGNDGVQMFYQNQPMTGNNHSSYQREMVQVRDEVGFGRFLLKCKAQWAKAEAERQAKQAKERKDQAEKLCQKLENFYWPDFIADPEEAEAAITQVAELFPEADIPGLRQKWTAAQARHQQQKAKEQAEKEAEWQKQQLYQQKLDEFRAAWQAHIAERERLWGINREKVEALKARWDVAFAYYELWYAAYAPADPEEGSEAEIEERKVDCLAPYAEPLHLEIKRGGKVTAYRYSKSHIIKVGQEIRTTAGAYKNSGYLSLRDWTGLDEALRYAPGADLEKLEADLALTFEAMPTEPEPDPSLHYNDVKRIQRGQEPEDELLF
ncbi:MAG: cell envelope integrity protein TolA [Anaerolineales bacterium]|nr:cell envelope integrity protein TolA [Anaerolineales bacterium]